MHEIAPLAGTCRASMRHCMPRHGQPFAPTAPCTRRIRSCRPAGSSTDSLRSALRPGLPLRRWSSGGRRPKPARIFPFDLAWDVDSQKLASNLFATSIIPYAGFLYHLQKSRQAPRLMLFGFYFLLVFVLATIVAGIYAKLNYGTILANVDWLHGSAESFLTITNLLIVLGIRQGIQEAQAQKRKGQQQEPASRDLDSS